MICLIDYSRNKYDSHSLEYCEEVWNLEMEFKDFELSEEYSTKLSNKFEVGLWLGNLYQKNNEFLKAMEVFYCIEAISKMKEAYKSCLTVKPTDFHAREKMGEYYSNLGLLESSVKCFYQAVEHCGQNIQKIISIYEKWHLHLKDFLKKNRRNLNS